MNKQLTLGSLFDGSGGFPLAGLLSGIQPVWKSEIEPFPLMVTHKRFPNMKNYGDISCMDGGRIEPVDIITFGSPCFPAGTLVLTDNGYKEIEDIKVGDMVLTHKCRWKRVTATGSKSSETMILKGNHYGLECTPNHPIYSYNGNKYTWKQAQDMKGLLWGVPSHIEYLPPPLPKKYESKRIKALPDFSEGFFYFIGRWLGDGWVRDSQRCGRPLGQRYSTIFLCDSGDKLDELIRTVNCISEKFSIENSKTCVKVKCNGRAICDFLTENFGKYAHGKELPAWVFTMSEEYRKALLQGVIDSDGYDKKNTYRISTVSKKLAHGLRLLAETLGYSTTVYFDKRPSKYIIEDRIVNQRDSYIVEICKNKTDVRKSDGFRSWYKVKNILALKETKTVYNLTVDEDNSYTADNIIVHNCQDMSVAGKRDGLDGSRSSLFYEAIRVIKEMRCATNGKYPRYIVWENVPGAFSSNKGEDFRCVLQAICKIKDETFDVPKPDKWQFAGKIMADDFSLAWRVFDAQYWGVPQRRKRIYLVADFTGRSADKILFESEGLSGYSAKSLRSWQRTAGGFEKSLDATGYDGYNGDLTGDVSATLGVNCGIASGRNGVVLNDQGGNRMDVTDDVTCTLRAEAHHPLCVMEAAGFCTEHSAKARSIGYEEGKSPTLRAGTVPAAIAIENHPADGRVKIEDDGKIQTLTERMGTGGGNVPILLKIHPEYEAGNCGEKARFYDVRFTSEGTKNARQNVYETDTARTIDTGGNSPDANQGGVAVVCVDQGGGKSFVNISEEKSPTLSATHGGEPAVCVQGSVIGRKDKNGPKGSGINEDVSFTLNATDKHVIAYGIDRAAFNQGKNALYNFAIEEEVEPTIVAKGPCAVAEPTYSANKASFFTKIEKNKSGTLQASDYKDPPFINSSDGIEYTVRRLTPTECARLQGFPDWWCNDLAIEEPTSDDITFWNNVFETYRKATNPDKKPKSDKQITKWLKNPHSDSAEYKMWGNGIHLGTAYFVMCGIVWATESETPS